MIAYGKYILLDSIEDLVLTEMFKSDGSYELLAVSFKDKVKALLKIKI